MKRDKIIQLIVSCGVPIIIGIFGSFFVANSMDWYQTLKKPIFNPPSQIFGPIWIVLYLLMGIAFLPVWQKGLRDAGGRTATACFILQLIFNAFWMPIFFGFKQPLIAFGDIVILWLAVLATVVSFYKVSKLAGILLVPYILWISFAAVLNGWICILNQ